MPGYRPKEILAPFSGVVTEAAVQACTQSYPAEYINNILELSNYLIDLANRTTLFGSAVHDPYSPSLKTLYDRLQAGYLTVSPLPATTKDANRLKPTVGQRTKVLAAERPLEDFEDLYYAVIARMQAMMQTLNMRLSSGFNVETDLLFEGGPNITNLHASLTQYWDRLNDAACVRALEDAVRQSRVLYIYQEVMLELDLDIITQDDAHQLLDDLFTDKDSTEGLDPIRCGSPAMIGAWLEEKYRVLLQLEKEENERHAREVRKRAKMKLAPKVKKSRSRSPKKRSSVERMLSRAQNGLARLKDGPGMPVSHAMRRKQHFNLDSPTMDHQMEEQTHLNQEDISMHMDVQPIDKTERVEIARRAQLPYQMKDEGLTHQDRLQQALTLEWDVKIRRVSNYTQYLRDSASRDAQRNVQDTTTTTTTTTTTSNTRLASTHTPPIQDFDTEYSHLMEF
jgi:hypothetical protein